MNRGINIVINTKGGVVKTGFFVTTDIQVDLLYRVVESGMYGTMVKKHWSFAILEGDEVLAMSPLYKRIEKNGQTRYQPRIAPNMVRGSVSGLLIMLEALAEGAEKRRLMDSTAGNGDSDLGREIDALERHLGVTRESDPSMLISSQVAAVAEDVSSVETGGASEQGLGTAQAESPDLESDGTISGEIVVLDDGTQVQVTEWEPVDGVQSQELLDWLQAQQKLADDVGSGETDRASDGSAH